MLKTSKKKLKTALPKFLKPLFWDYRFNQLSWPDDKDLIAARVLAYGDWRAITWLHRRWGTEQLRQWLVRRNGRGLDPKRLRFWELVVELPHRHVNDWLKVKEHDIWQKRVAA
jgi:hypothetical protein